MNFGRTQVARNPSITTEALSTGDNPLYRRTFVGREAELKQVQSAFDAALSGQGGLVMVVGEPGIGKTALCEQLATYVALRGGKALVGHCYEEGSLSLPYLAFVEAMRSYVLAREPDGLRSDLGTGAADVARIVSEVRDRVQGVELRPAGDPEDDRWRLLQAVTSFLRNASTVQPLCIVLEDLHWADRGTLDLLVHVARNLAGARLLIVGTYRDVEVDRSHPLSATLAELGRATSFARVRLRGLTVDEVHRLYESVRGQAVPWGQAEAVHRQTEGNPLFVQEVLRYLVEEGIVVREGGRYVAQGGEGVGIPEGLRDVVGRRLSRLSEKANQVLAIAAVMGREFRLDMLQRVAGLSEEEVETALQEAQERAIIEARSAMGALGFRFSHAFFRQTLYEEIFASRRLRLHQQVARALEEVYARRLEDHASELAEHFALSTDAADLEKALHYSELAAQRAISVFDYGEAVRHLEQALKVLEVLDPDDKTKRCDLLLALGDALITGGGSVRAASEVAPKAFVLAQELVDESRSFRASYLALRALTAHGIGPSGATPEYGAWAERADAYAAPETIERVWADRALGHRRQARGEAGSSDLFQRALDLARRLDDRAAMFSVAGQMLIQQFPNPADQEARLRLTEEILSWPRDGIRHVELGSVLWNSGQVLLSFGQRERAEAIWKEVAELADRTKDPTARRKSMETGIVLATFDGELEKAIELIELMEASGGELGQESAVTLQKVLYSIRLMNYLGRASIYGSEPPGIERPITFLSLFFVDRVEEARDSYLQVSQRQPQPIAFGLSMLEMATLLQDEAGVKARFHDMHDAEGLLGIWYWDQSCLARHLGAAAALLDQPDEARRLYGVAIESCAKVRHRPEMALSRLGLAELLLEHYRDEHDAAIEHLDFAIGELRDMKMQPALERALRHRGLLKA